MPIIKLSESGIPMKLYSKAEQDATWKEIEQDISPIGKNIALYTPQDNLEYFIVSETEVKFQTYVVVLSIKGNCYAVKCNICNQDKVTYKKVREIYNK